jgi:hypothetical protein
MDVTTFVFPDLWGCGFALKPVSASIIRDGFLSAPLSAAGLEVPVRICIV